MISSANVHLDNAHKTPQFWLIWMVLCMNVSAGIGVLAARQKVPLLLDPKVRKFGLLGGVAGALGMLALILGAQVGSLGTVSVIAGSSPAVTVIAAATFDGDRVHWWQAIGVVGSIIGTGIIALGS